MKTLIYDSYQRSAYIWLKQLPDKLNKKDQLIKDRLVKKLELMKEDLQIDKKYQLDSIAIK